MATGKQTNANINCNETHFHAHWKTKLDQEWWGVWQWSKLARLTEVYIGTITLRNYLTVSPEAEHVHSCENTMSTLSCSHVNKCMHCLHGDDETVCIPRHCKGNKPTCAVLGLKINETLNLAQKSCPPCKNNFITDFCGANIWKQDMTFVDTIIT